MKPAGPGELDAVRGFLNEQPEVTTVVWDRAFTMSPDARAYAVGNPPRAVLGVASPGWAHGDHGIGLHAIDVEAAREVAEAIPSGPAFVHLTDERWLPMVKARAPDLHAWPGWLFRLDREAFVDVQRHRVVPVKPEWAARIAEVWSPGWPAEDLIRSRIENGPSAAIVEDGEPVAWAMTHCETATTSLMGFMHVLDEHRGKGYARSVAAALVKDALRRGKTPLGHVDVENVASLRLTETLGFRKVKIQMWADGEF